jgi:hypothetical protein
LITISCTLTLLLGGCAAVSVKDDNRPVEIVISKEPTVGSHYLRHAELLERIDEDKDAHRTYEKGLEKVPEYNPDQIQLMHRLALVDANPCSNSMKLKNS